MYTKSMMFTMGWAEILDHAPCGQLLMLDYMSFVGHLGCPEASPPTNHGGRGGLMVANW